MSTEPGTALERRQQIKPVAIPTDDEIRRQWRIAEALAQSGMFPDAKEAAQAFAKILVGHDLGLSATQSLMGVYLVKGKPQIAATLLASFVKRTPGYDYEVIDHDEMKCQIAFMVDGGEPKISSFTIEDAERANLVKADSAWKAHPRNMLFARAMSNGVKWYMPDATGGVAVYSEGELSAVEPLQLTAGQGTGEAQGLDLGPKVEAVLARAAEVGHEAIADRATAEMALGGRSPEVAVEWVKAKTAELDDFERSIEATADEVPEADVPATERIEAAHVVAEQLDRDAAEAEAAGEDDKAAGLRAGAAQQREMADALENGDES